MSHWNRRAWNPNGGRYAAHHYPVQQQQTHPQKHDVLADSDDDDDSPSDEGIATQLVLVSGRM